MSRFHTAAHGVGARSQGRFRIEVLTRAGYRCEQCGKLGGAKMEAHHIKSLASGGEHHPDNGQCLCVGCHIAIHRPNAVDTQVTAWQKMLTDILLST